MLATLGLPLIAASGAITVFSVALVAATALFLCAVALLACVVGAGIAAIGLLFFGIVIAVMWGWWLIVPALFFALVAKVVWSRRRYSSRRY
jgi:hypothetical protein